MFPTASATTGPRNWRPGLMHFSFSVAIHTCYNRPVSSSEWPAAWNKNRKRHQKTPSLVATGFVMPRCSPSVDLRSHKCDLRKWSVPWQRLPRSALAHRGHVGARWRASGHLPEFILLWLWWIFFPECGKNEAKQNYKNWRMVSRAWNTAGTRVKTFGMCLWNGVVPFSRRIKIIPRNTYSVYPGKSNAPFPVG